jgi:rare lipoprotein A (peptidoglycan hydrolase)
MKFRLLIFFLLIACKPIDTTYKNKSSYLKKGFAYIYDESDKNFKKKYDNKKLIVGHNKLKIGTLVSITNLTNQKQIILKVQKRVKYPEFYTLLINEEVAKQINLDKAVPLVEVQEIKKNKSFIAKKAKMFAEEKKINNKAPVTNIKIDNISKIKNKKKRIDKKFTIEIGSFYSLESAKFLMDKLSKELAILKSKFYINKKLKSYTLISGPYKTINSLKNDYIILKNYGFEDLEINLK